MRWFADLAYLIAAILYAPIALYHVFVTGKHRTGWAQRFGRVPLRDAGKRRVWVHAVSLGEINATPKLVEALQRELPEYEFVFSTTTDTGYARAVQLYGSERVFRFPLDFSWVIARALDRVRPSMIVLMELEVWYNFTRMAAGRGVPIVVANGRLTERSAKRFGWIAPLVQPMFADIAWVGAQDEPTAGRFRAVGVRPDRVAVTSSLKWDTAVVTDRIPGDDALAASLGLSPGSALWVCGSTGPGEEEIILDAYQRLVAGRQDGEGEKAAGFVARNVQGSGVETDARPIRVAIVPRKPERFEEVARLIARRGFDCVRRSAHPDGALPSERTTNVGSGPTLGTGVAVDDSLGVGAVILGDTMGELRKFYSLAGVVFVGRSLVPMGGSDVMEVAALGKPILVGPHTENFREAVASLKAADAVETVDSASTLSHAVDRLQRDSSARADLGGRAREVVLRHQGATQRTVRGILAVLGRTPAAPVSSALEERPIPREHEKGPSPIKAVPLQP